MAAQEAIKAAAKGFVDFVNKGPSPYHVVQECRRRLLASSFTELKETEPWSIQPCGKYFVINNFSTIIVFAVGGKYRPGNGYTIVGAHTDSPCLKLKPHSARSRAGCTGVGVQVYGGGIWHTWFDRDLKVAGRAVVKSGPGCLSHRLVHIDRPLLRVPNICIHLARQDVHNAFAPNTEKHLVPILATALGQQLEAAGDDASPAADAATSPATSTAGHHPALLVKLLCETLECKPEDLMDFELCLADTQPAVVGGALEEFIFAPRIDNLLNCHTGLEALLNSLGSLATEKNIRILALFDNEEVGSVSAQGAQSSIVEYYLRRLCAGWPAEGGPWSPVAFEESIPKSFMISADQAHAVHPNYSDKHEQNHQPLLHGGPVLKVNANQRYATTAITAAVLRELADMAKVPLQDVVVRNDSACGSTIGPMLSARLGMRTVDIGGPTLSMHSIREQCCTSSVTQCTQLFTSFYENFPNIHVTASAMDQ